jgi:hypothetical protein
MGMSLLKYITDKQAEQQEHESIQQQLQFGIDEIEEMFEVKA